MTIKQRRGHRWLECEIDGKHIAVFSKRMIIYMMSGAQITFETRRYQLKGVYTRMGREQ